MPDNPRYASTTRGPATRSTCCTRGCCRWSWTRCVTGYDRSTWTDSVSTSGYTGRKSYGFDPNGGFFDALRQDPVLSQVKLIAEPWDIGPGGYQLGRIRPASRSGTIDIAMASAGSGAAIQASARISLLGFRVPPICFPIMGGAPGRRSITLLRTMDSPSPIPSPMPTSTMKPTAKITETVTAIITRRTGAPKVRPTIR